MLVVSAACTIMWTTSAREREPERAGLGEQRSVPGQDSGIVGAVQFRPDV
jgi:hypothetical protein